MNTLFISDLHLSDKRPDLTQLFVQFIQQHCQQIDALYILGDLFDAWIGDDDNSPIAQLVKKELRACSERGISIYFLSGNRDFLLGEQFAKQAGMQILKNPTQISLYGVSTLLLHGDRLCTQDKAFMRYLDKVYNEEFQHQILAKPLWQRRWLAKFYRLVSKWRGRWQQAELADACPQAILQTADQHPVRQIIHGHTHRPAIHHFPNTQKLPVTRYVLSDWHQQGNALLCTPEGESRLFYFPSSKS